MDTALMIAADLVAVTVLALGLYFPRHRRRDLVGAFVGINVGVVAVAAMLGRIDVGLGMGLGLFGVLSIIRLRSSEIDQHEVAYYFASLALGLVAGLSATVSPLALALMALILLGLFVGDHPALLSRYEQRTVLLDTAHTDPVALRAAVESLVGGTVVRVFVRRLDLVDDTTLVEVRYRLPDGSGRRAAEAVPVGSSRAFASVEAVRR